MLFDTTAVSVKSGDRSPLRLPVTEDSDSREASIEDDHSSSDDDDIEKDLAQVDPEQAELIRKINKLGQNGSYYSTDQRRFGKQGGTLDIRNTAVLHHKGSMVVTPNEKHMSSKLLKPGHLSPTIPVRNSTDLLPPAKHSEMDENRVSID